MWKEEPLLTTGENIMGIPIIEIIIETSQNTHSYITPEYISKVFKSYHRESYKSMFVFPLC